MISYLESVLSFIVLEFFIVDAVVFQDSVTLYSAGCPGTYGVDQAPPLPPKSWT